MFSALAASIDGEVEFNEIGKNIGILEVSMDSKLLINDGQHRKAAIIEALKEDITLNDENRLFAIKERSKYCIKLFEICSLSSGASVYRITADTNKINRIIFFQL